MDQSDIGAQVRATAQNAQQAAAAAQSEGCKVCKRLGLPILPLRYAVVPKGKRKGTGPALHSTLGAGIKDVALPADTHEYAIRTLREGYVYVLLDKKIWQAYEVTEHGHLRQFNPFNFPKAPPKPLEVRCRDEGHDIAGGFLNIDTERYKNALVAYTQEAWTKTVLDEYKSGKRPSERFLKLDLAKLQSSPDAVEHAFEIDKKLKRLSDGVEEFVKGAKDFGSAHNFHSRYENTNKLQNYAEKYKNKLPAIVLSDTAGLISELNFSRTKEVMNHQEWASSEVIAHKRLSSDAIKGVREAVKNSIRADVDKRFDGKPKTQELRYHGAYVATTTITPEQQVEHEARIPLQRIEKHYDEAARAAFDKEYDKKVKIHTDALAKLDSDYMAWLKAKTQVGAPNLMFLCEHDFDENDLACGAGYIRLVGQVVAGGPNQHSLSWFEKNLSLPASNPHQILFRAMVGNYKPFLQWVDEEKTDKVYDEIRALADAGRLEKAKWLSPAVALYAHPILAAVGATAFVLNKDLSVNKALRDHITHLAKVSIRLWEKIEVQSLKLRMSLGDYHQSLLRGAYPSMPKGGSKINAGGRAASRLPAKFKLPPALANKTAEILFWTTGKLDDVLALIPKAPAQSAAVNWVEVANQRTQSTLASGQKTIRRALGPGKARELGTLLVKRIDTVAGSRTGLLAAGVLILQWQQVTENTAAIINTGGEKALSGAFGLGDALLSITSASLEIGAVLKQKVAFDKIAAASLLRWAAGFGAGASLFNMAESAVKAKNRFTGGDTDAAFLYGGSGLAFTGAAYSSVLIVRGAQAAFLGPLLGLGPVGWGFICVGAALLLYYAAVQAEDNAAEKWVAKNKFWSKSQRTDEPYKNWLEEAQALNVLGYGMQAELDWTGKWIPGMDTIKMRVSIPNYDADFGAWRYRLIGTLNGIEMEIYNKQSGGNITPLPPLHPPRPAEMRPATGKFYQDGQDFKFYDSKIEFKSEPYRYMLVEHNFGVDSSIFSEIRLQFEYLEDVNDQSSLARIELSSKYDK